MKITVVGTGYVGLSLATLLSQFHDVIALDIDQSKIDNCNSSILEFVNKKKIEIVDR